MSKIHLFIISSLLFLISGCGDSSSTTSTTIDNRVCVGNELVPEAEEEAIFTQGFLVGVDVLKASPSGVVMCGDPVTIDAVVQSESPKSLANALTEGEVL